MSSPHPIREHEQRASAGPPGYAFHFRALCIVPGMLALRMVLFDTMHPHGYGKRILVGLCSFCDCERCLGWITLLPLMGPPHWSAWPTLLGCALCPGCSPCEWCFSIRCTRTDMESGFWWACARFAIVSVVWGGQRYCRSWVRRIGPRGPPYPAELFRERATKTHRTVFGYITTTVL